MAGLCESGNEPPGHKDGGKEDKYGGEGHEDGGEEDKYGGEGHEDKDDKYGGEENAARKTNMVVKDTKMVVKKKIMGVHRYDGEELTDTMVKN
ncbi:hypothetical protein ANN_20247 [Periplaneta americana]|uniref:Uncharacterized protein n=1 Tax=Periplaneta americana TaxID=6978 RepID=A0ABQ8SCK4_PERAM|nr:hypothetical protein ANN_20247 [Periplaneta americana]